MSMVFFKKFIPKRFLGIDIGTTAIKIVELSGWGERKKLENYGEISAKAIYEKPFRTFEKSTLLLSSQDIARAIKSIIKEAKIKTRESVFSIPDFSSFFTTFELPSMTKEELPQAVNYEARQHVPLPLGEVTLDWQMIENQRPSRERERLKILLVAVPNEVINQYQKIAELAKIQSSALEAEVFGLVRSLIPGDDKGVIGIVDIGARSTTCSIIDNLVLKTSYSFDMAGNELTNIIAKSLTIDYQEAENLKKKHGLQTDSQFKNIKEILTPLIDVILREIERVSQNFYQNEGKEVQKFIIAGGSALIPELKEYFENYLKKEVKIANPFSNIFYPPILEKKLKEMGPSYAIAVGMALRGLE